MLQPVRDKCFAKPLNIVSKYIVLDAWTSAWAEMRRMIILTRPKELRIGNKPIGISLLWQSERFA